MRFERIGGYRVTTKIGEGGMGEVYRARDTDLDRDVAIKVLPEAFTSDPDRLARFEREAKVLASLNHPNIGAIYGLEKSGDTRALVLELIEGPTLAERIKQGPIPVDEALPIAKQIAEALEAAHEQGIIHRDLKPADDPSRPHIEHDGEIEKPGPRREIGDVGHPEAVRALSRKVTVDVIEGPVRRGITDGRRHKATRMQPPEARRPHQPSHSFFADAAVVIIGQLRCALGSVVHVAAVLTTPDVLLGTHQREADDEHRRGHDPDKDDPRQAGQPIVRPRSTLHGAQPPPRASDRHHHGADSRRVPDGPQSVCRGRHAGWLHRAVVAVCARHGFRSNEPPSGEAPGALIIASPMAPGRRVHRASGCGERRAAPSRRYLTRMTVRRNDDVLVVRFPPLGSKSIVVKYPRTSPATTASTKIPTNPVTRMSPRPVRCPDM